MSQNGWKTYGSKVVHKNPFMRVVAYDVQRPNGNRAPYYVVERGSFAIAIPLTLDHQTYLVGQYRFSVKAFSWEFPMGYVPNVAPLPMAKQELAEETGITAKDWQPVGYFHVAPGHSDQLAHVFMAKNLTVGVATPEPNEFLEVKQMPLVKVGEMIAAQKILDGPTICAFHLLEVYLKQ